MNLDVSTLKPIPERGKKKTKKQKHFGAAIQDLCPEAPQNL